MKRLVTGIVLFTSIYYQVSAQTDLYPGDLAFVNFSADGRDEFTFVCLVDIDQGTTFYFTDKAWNGSGFTDNSEVEILLTVPTGGWSKGTVVEVEDNEQLVVYDGLGGSTTISSAFTSSPDNFGDLSTSGDQVFLFQKNGSDFHFIAGYTSNRESGFTDANWDGQSNSNQRTHLPDDSDTNIPVGRGLTTGSTALRFSNDGNDNGDYTGITSGLVEEFLAAMNDESNWTIDNDDGTNNDDTPITQGITILNRPQSADATISDAVQSQFYAFDLSQFFFSDLDAGDALQSITIEVIDGISGSTITPVSNAGAASNTGIFLDLNFNGDFDDGEELTNGSNILAPFIPVGFLRFKSPTTGVYKFGFSVNDGIYDSENGSEAGANVIDITVLSAATLSTLNQDLSNPTNGTGGVPNQVTWTADFSTVVTGLTAANFSLTGSLAGTSSISNVAVGTGNTWDITVDLGSGDGTLGLDFDDNINLDPVVTNTLINGVDAFDNEYDVDQTDPTLSPVLEFVAQSPDLSNVDLKLNFNEPLAGAGSEIDYSIFSDVNADPTTPIDPPGDIIQSISINGGMDEVTLRLDLTSLTSGHNLEVVVANLTDVAGNAISASTNFARIAYDSQVPVMSNMIYVDDTELTIDIADSGPSGIDLAVLTTPANYQVDVYDGDPGGGGSIVTNGGDLQITSISENAGTISLNFNGAFNLSLALDGHVIRLSPDNVIDQFGNLTDDGGGNNFLDLDVDRTSPEVDPALVFNSNTSLTLVFDQSTDAVKTDLVQPSAENPANYVVLSNGATRVPTAITLTQDANFPSVDMTFGGADLSNSMTGNNITVTATSVDDIFGNSTATASNKTASVTADRNPPTVDALLTIVDNNTLSVLFTEPVGESGINSVTANDENNYSFELNPPSTPVIPTGAALQGDGLTVELDFAGDPFDLGVDINDGDVLEVTVTDVDDGFANVMIDNGTTNVSSVTVDQTEPVFSSVTYVSDTELLLSFTETGSGLDETTFDRTDFAIDIDGGASFNPDLTGGVVINGNDITLFIVDNDLSGASHNDVINVVVGDGNIADLFGNTILDSDGTPDAMTTRSFTLDRVAPRVTSNLTVSAPLTLSFNITDDDNSILEDGSELDPASYTVSTVEGTILGNPAAVGYSSGTVTLTIDLSPVPNGERLRVVVAGITDTFGNDISSGSTDGTLIYSSLSGGTFITTNSIAGGNLASTATIVTDDGSTTMTISGASGAFEVTETITCAACGGGVTAVVDTYIPAGNIAQDASTGGVTDNIAPSILDFDYVVNGLGSAKVDQLNVTFSEDVDFVSTNPTEADNIANYTITLSTDGGAMFNPLPGSGITAINANGADGVTIDLDATSQLQPGVDVVSGDILRIQINGVGDAFDAANNVLMGGQVDVTLDFDAPLASVVNFIDNTTLELVFNESISGLETTSATTNSNYNVFIDGNNAAAQVIAVSGVVLNGNIATLTTGDLSGASGRIDVQVNNVADNDGNVFVATLTYTSLVNTFTNGNTVTGGTSGATATIQNDDMASSMELINLVGIFDDVTPDQISEGSATADIAVFNDNRATFTIDATQPTVDATLVKNSDTELVITIRELGESGAVGSGLNVESDNMSPEWAGSALNPDNYTVNSNGSPRTVSSIALNQFFNGNEEVSELTLIFTAGVGNDLSNASDGDVISVQAESTITDQQGNTIDPSNDTAAKTLDTAPPEVVAALVYTSGASSADLTFLETGSGLIVDIDDSRGLFAVSAANPANYSVEVNSSPGPAVNTIGILGNTMTLNFLSALASEGGDIQITVNNVTDEDGNPVSLASNSVASIFVDDTKPTASAPLFLNDNQLQLTLTEGGSGLVFGSTVDTESASNPNNYMVTINHDAGGSTGRVVDDVDIVFTGPSTYTITLNFDGANDLTPALNLDDIQIDIANIQDINGNIIDPVMLTIVDLDRILPEVQSLTFVTTTELLVTFSEEVDQALAEDINNYLFTGGTLSGLNPNTATLGGPGNDEVTLNVNDFSATPDGTQIIVTVSNVKDLTNNLLDPGATEGSFDFDAAPPTITSAVINKGNATRVFLNFNESINTSGDPDGELIDLEDNFSILLGPDPSPTVVGFTTNTLPAANQIGIGIDQSIQAGELVRVLYTPSASVPPSENDIIDAFNNKLALIDLAGAVVATNNLFGAPSNLTPDCLIEGINLTWIKPPGTNGVAWDGVFVVGRESAAVDAGMATTLQTIDLNSATFSTDFAAGLAGSDGVSRSGDNVFIANFTADADGDIDITGFTSGNTYHFSAYAYKSTDPMTHEVSTQDISTSAEPTFIETMTAFAGNEEATLTWTNSSLTSCVDNILILGRQGAPIESNVDFSELEAQTRISVGITLDIESISLPDASTTRYTFNGSPDLFSFYEVGDNITVSSAMNGANNGIFIITAIDDAADFIDVTNAGGVVVASGSSAEVVLDGYAQSRIFDVNTITDQGANIFRYTFNGSPVLSDFFDVNDQVSFTSSGNPNNDGTFTVLAVSDAMFYLDVDNPIGADEGAGSPSELIMQPNNYKGAFNLNDYDGIGVNGHNNLIAHIGPVSGGSVTITGLENNITYFFKAFLFDDAGSGPDVSASVTTSVEPLGAPFNPTGFTVDCATENEINLSWTKPTGTFQTNWHGVVVYGAEIFDLTSIVATGAGQVTVGFNVGTDLSAFNPGDEFVIESADNSAQNDGTFSIITVDDGNDLIIISNPLRSVADGFDETPPAAATGRASFDLDFTSEDAPLDGAQNNGIFGSGSVVEVENGASVVAVVESDDQNNHNAVISNIQGNKSYAFRAFAYRDPQNTPNTGDDDLFSTGTSVETVITPGGITNLATSAGDGVVDLSWDLPADAACFNNVVVIAAENDVDPDLLVQGNLNLETITVYGGVDPNFVSAVNFKISGGADIIDGNKLVFNGNNTSTNVQVTNLNNGTEYEFIVFLTGDQGTGEATYSPGQTIKATPSGPSSSIASGTPNATISSIVDDPGSTVFEFIITDDDGVEGDDLEMLISDITITENFNLDVSAITFEADGPGSGNTRYFFSGSPDLTGFNIGEKLEIDDPLNSTANEGVFDIVAINVASFYMDVANGSGVTEGSSTAVAIANPVENWSNAILGASLSSGATLHSGTVNINPSDIQFLGINTATISSLGFIEDGTLASPKSKTYTLRIWLNPALANPSTIDDQQFSFEVNSNNIVVSGSGFGDGLVPDDPNNPQSAEDIVLVDVVATELVFTDQPPSSINTGVAFTAGDGVEVTARDVNGFTDRQFGTMPTDFTISNANNIPLTGVAASTFVNGVLDLAGLTYNTFGGDGTLTISDVGAIASDAVSTLVTVNDVDPPAFNSVPGITLTTDQGFTITVNLDELNAQVFWMVSEIDLAGSVTISDIVNNNGGVQASSFIYDQGTNMDQSILIDGLDPGTTYYIYLFADDGSNQTSIQTAFDFGDSEAFDITLSNQGAPGLTATVTGEFATAIEMTFQLDEIGFVDYIVYTHDPMRTPPSFNDVINGIDPEGGAPLDFGVVNITTPDTDFQQVVSFLTENTTYDVWIAAEDDDGLNTTPVQLLVTSPMIRDIMTVMESDGLTGLSITAPDIPGLCVGDFFPLADIILDETADTDIESTGSVVKNFILTLPSGFEFNTAASVTAVVPTPSSTTNITNADGSGNIPITVESNRIILEIATGGTNRDDNITISGLEVRADVTAVVNTTIDLERLAGDALGGDLVILGAEGGNGRAYATLTPVNSPSAPPALDITQNLCEGATLDANIGLLTTNSATYEWYNAPDLALVNQQYVGPVTSYAQLNIDNVIDGADPSKETHTYYVIDRDAVTLCPSPAAEVNISLNIQPVGNIIEVSPAALDVDVTNLLCRGDQVILQGIEATGQVTGVSYKWTYDDLSTIQVYDDVNDLNTNIASDNGQFLIMVPEATPGDGFTAVPHTYYLTVTDNNSLCQSDPISTALGTKSTIDITVRAVEDIVITPPLFVYSEAVVDPQTIVAFPSSFDNDGDGMGDDPVDYTVNFSGSGLSNENLTNGTVDFTPFNAGVNSHTITYDITNDDTNCSISESIEIVVTSSNDPVAGADDKYCNEDVDDTELLISLADIQGELDMDPTLSTSLVARFEQGGSFTDLIATGVVPGKRVNYQWLDDQNIVIGFSEDMGDPMTNPSLVASNFFLEYNDGTTTTPIGAPDFINVAAFDGNFSYITLRYTTALTDMSIGVDNGDVLFVDIIGGFDAMDPSVGLKNDLGNNFFENGSTVTVVYDQLLTVRDFDVWRFNPRRAYDKIVGDGLGLDGEQHNVTLDLFLVGPMTNELRGTFSTLISPLPVVTFNGVSSQYCVTDTDITLDDDLDDVDVTITNGGQTDLLTILQYSAYYIDGMGGEVFIGDYMGSTVNFNTLVDDAVGPGLGDPTPGIYTTSTTFRIRYFSLIDEDPLYRVFDGAVELGPTFTQPEGCTNSGSVDFIIHPEPVVPTITNAPNFTAMDGTLVFEFCEGDAIPDLAISGPQTLVKYNWKEDGVNPESPFLEENVNGEDIIVTSLVPKGDQIRATELFGSPTPIAGVYEFDLTQTANRDPNPLDFTNFIGCESQELNIRFIIREVPDAPVVTNSPFEETDLGDIPPGFDRYYFFEFCEDEFDPADIAGSETTFGTIDLDVTGIDPSTEFRWFDDMGGLISGNSATINAATLGISGALFAPNTYRFSVIRRDFNDPAFVGCESGSTLIDVIIHPEPLALENDPLVNIQTEFFLCSGEDLAGNIQTPGTSQVIYRWYEDDGFGNPDLAMGEIAVSAISGREIEQSELPGFNNTVSTTTTYSYWVTQTTNDDSETNLTGSLFPGCESQATEIVITVYPFDEEPAISGFDNIGGALSVATTQTDPDPVPEFYQYYFCLGEITSDYQFDAVSLNGGTNGLQFNWYRSNAAGDAILQLPTTDLDGSTATAQDLSLGTINPGASSSISEFFLVTQSTNFTDAQTPTLEFTIGVNGPFATNDVIEGVNSMAQATVIGISGSTLRLSGVTGDFEPGETLNVGITPKATVNTYKPAVTFDGCESPGSLIEVIVYDIPVEPGVENLDFTDGTGSTIIENFDSDFYYCEGSTIANIVVIGESEVDMITADEEFYWYANEGDVGTVGSRLNITTSMRDEEASAADLGLSAASAPGDYTYYITQAQDINTSVTPTFDGCEGPAREITVHILDTPEIPDVNDPAAVCSVDPIPEIVVSGAVSGDVFRWYTQAATMAGGFDPLDPTMYPPLAQTSNISPNFTPMAADVPSVTNNFVVYRINDINIDGKNFPGCTSLGKDVVVTIFTEPGAPTMVSNAYEFCQNDDVSSATFNINSPANDVRYSWYATGPAAAPTDLIKSDLGINDGGEVTFDQVAAVTALDISVGTLTTTTIFVTQETDGLCEGVAQPVTITVNPLPIVNFTDISPSDMICADGTDFVLTPTFGGSTPMDERWFIDGVELGAGLTDNMDGTVTFDPLAAVSAAMPSDFYDGSASRTIEYVFTDIEGCVGTSQQTIEINGLPSVSISLETTPNFGINEYCIETGTIDLQGSSLSSGSGTFTSAVSNTPISNNPGNEATLNLVTAFGIVDMGANARFVDYPVTFTFTTDDGCVNSVDQIIRINNTPEPEFEIRNDGMIITPSGGVDAEICIDDAGTITFNNSTPGAMGTISSGDFTVSGAGFIFDDTDEALTKDSEGNYTFNVVDAMDDLPAALSGLTSVDFTIDFTFTNDLGCTGQASTFTNSQVIRVFRLPVPTLTVDYTGPNLDNSYCRDDLTDINITVSSIQFDVAGGTGVYSVTPNVMGGALTQPGNFGAESAVFDPQAALTAAVGLGLTDGFEQFSFDITYQYTSGQGCVNTSAPLTLTVNPIPNVTIVFDDTDAVGVALNEFCVDNDIIELDGAAFYGVDEATGVTAVGSGEFFSDFGGVGAGGPGIIPTGPGRADFDLALAFDDEGAERRTHQLTYQFTDNRGCQFFDNTDIIINKLPEVSLEPLGGCEGEDVTLESTLIDIAPDDAVSRYFWDFGETAGDADRDTTTVNSAAFAYSEFGVFSPELVVESSKGCLSPVTSTDVTVGEIPDVNFTYTGLAQDQAFVFDATPRSINFGTIDTIRFEFNDGSAVVERFDLTDDDESFMVTHQFNAANVYEVELQLITNNNCFQTHTRFVPVLPKISVEASNPYIQTFEQVQNEVRETLANQLQVLYADGWVPDYRTIDNKRLDEFNDNPDFGRLRSELNTWDIGSPAGATITGAADGNNAWVTNLSGSYADTENSWIFTPAFDLSGLTRPLIRFDQIFDFNSARDGVIIEYSTDNGGSWDRLGDFDGDDATGINWYNRIAIQAMDIGTNDGQIGWSEPVFEELVTWKESLHKLDEIPVDLRSNVIFRFSMSSVSTQNGEGYGIDNFIIEERSRLLLIEQFSGFVDGPITEANTDLVQVLDDITVNNNDGVVITYQTDLNNSSTNVDAINATNPNDPNARVFFYGVENVPASVLNGQTDVSGGFNTNTQQDSRLPWSSNDFNNESLKDPLIDLNLDLNATVSGDLVAVDVRLSGNELTGSNLNDQTRLYIAVVEKTVESGGITLRNVLRRFLPDGSGNVILTEGGDLISSVSQSWRIDRVGNPDNLAVIAFVQNSDDRVILQAVTVDVGNKDDNIVTSIDDEEFELNEESITLYPNPAHEEMFVTFDVIVEEDFDWVIYNQVGARIVDGQLKKGEDGFSVDTSTLPSGMYFMFLSGEEKQFDHLKFIVRH